MKIVALSDLHIDESWRVEAGLNIPLDVIVNNIVHGCFILTPNRNL